MWLWPFDDNAAGDEDEEEVQQVQDKGKDKDTAGAKTDDSKGHRPNSGALATSAEATGVDHDDHHSDEDKEAPNVDDASASGAGAGGLPDLSPLGLRGRKHITRAPSRFTEASFIKELETVGVGRPSTYSRVSK